MPQSDFWTFSNNKIASDVDFKDLPKESSAEASREIVELRSRINEMNAERAEMKIILDEKSKEVEMYRNKYLQAQQRVEELKRRLDIVEYDDIQVTGQLQLEIKKMKIHFQEKLKELAPLPDLLKCSQLKLQEAKELQKLAEENSKQLSHELQRVNEKLVSAHNVMTEEMKSKVKIWNTFMEYKTSMEARLKELTESTKVLEESESRNLILQERLTQTGNLYKEKSFECVKLLKILEDVKNEHCQAIVRVKERSDATRINLQNQVMELERQLIQCRSQSDAYQKERDELRRRILEQLNNAHESFALMEMKLRIILNHSNTLRRNIESLAEDDIYDIKTL